MRKLRFVVHVMNGAAAGWFTTSNRYESGPPGSTSINFALPEHCVVISLRTTTPKSELRLPDLSMVSAMLASESEIPCLWKDDGGRIQAAYGAGSLFVFRLPRASSEDEVESLLQDDDRRLFKIAVLGTTPLAPEQRREPDGTARSR